jgi:uncharacterized protein DUF7009
MKLRIKGNTIRFRLTQTEIDSIGNGSVEDKTQFPDGDSLIYKIQKGDSFSSEFKDGAVIISVSSEVINEWASSNKVSIENSVKLKDGSALEVSLEKDFKCLTERPKEDETDMFPNPQEKHSKC